MLCILILFGKVNAQTLSKKLKVFVQGYYISSQLMTPVLYNEYVASHNANPNPYQLDDVDDITLELHDISDYSLKSSSLARLKTDGYVICDFLNTQPGNYFIAIKHRNAICTWTANDIYVGLSSDAVYINSAAYLYDFSDFNTKSYGNNVTQTYFYHSGSQLGAPTSDNVWKLYSGDINQDEAIDAQDYVDVLASGGSGGIVATDVNGDGGVDLIDLEIVYGNVFNAIFVLHP